MARTQTQQKIDNINKEIGAIKGNVAGIAPRPNCSDTGHPTNIFGLNNEILELQTLLTALLNQRAEEDANFEGIRFVLKFGTNNMPSLVGTSQSIVNLIQATGLRPPTVTITGIAVTVTGSNGIILTAPGTQNIMTAAERLAQFAANNRIVIDVEQAQGVKSANVERADQFNALAETQSDIIDIMLNGVPDQVGTKPSFDTTDWIVDGKEITIDFNATGTDPIEYEIDWGEVGAISLNASSPATHIYSDWDTEYDIVITASNSVGVATYELTVKTDEEPAGPPPGTAPTIKDVNVIVDGRDVVVEFDADGDAPITFQMDWNDDGNWVTVTSPASHTYDDWDTAYEAILQATNDEGTDTMNIPITTDEEPITPGVFDPIPPVIIEPTDDFEIFTNGTTTAPDLTNAQSVDFRFTNGSVQHTNVVTRITGTDPDIQLIAEDSTGRWYDITSIDGWWGIPGPPPAGVLPVGHVEDQTLYVIIRDTTTKTKYEITIEIMTVVEDAFNAAGYTRVNTIASQTFDIEVEP